MRRISFRLPSDEKEEILDALMPLLPAGVREESADGDDVAARQDGELATAGARADRSVGEPVPVKRPSAYDADDLEIPSFLRRK